MDEGSARELRELLDRLARLLSSDDQRFHPRAAEVLEAADIGAEIAEFHRPAPLATPDLNPFWGGPYPAKHRPRGTARRTTSDDDPYWGGPYPAA